MGRDHRQDKSESPDKPGDNILPINHSISSLDLPHETNWLFRHYFSRNNAMSSAKDNNPSVIEQRAEPTPGTGKEGYIDGGKDQANTAETGSSLTDLGNNASAMIGESFNEVTNRVSSISPGEVIEGVRERIQSMTNRNGNGGNAKSEQVAKQG